MSLPGELKLPADGSFFRASRRVSGNRGGSTEPPAVAPAPPGRPAAPRHPDPGRNGNREGSRGPADSPREPPRRRPLRGCELRSHSGDPCRSRALRLRAWGLYRRTAEQARAVPSSASGHDLSRRNRIAASANAFFFNDTATTEIYTLSLHAALLPDQLAALA